MSGVEDSPRVGDSPCVVNKHDAGTLCGADQVRVYHFHEVGGLGVGRSPLTRLGERGVMGTLWTICEFISVLATIAMICSVAAAIITNGMYVRPWCGGSLTAEPIFVETVENVDEPSAPVFE